LQDILTSFGISMQKPDVSRARSLSDDCSKDFQFIYMHLKKHYHRAEQLNIAMTGLAGIGGNKQASREQELMNAAAKRSVREAKSFKTLTIIVFRNTMHL
jgi:hypothetical protein